MQEQSIYNVCRNLGLPSRGALAVGIFLIALLIRLTLLPLDAGVVFVTLYPAMVICFYVCGVGVGAFMAVLSAIVAFYAFLPPYLSFSKPVSGDVALITFLVSAGLIGWVVRSLQLALGRGREREAELIKSDESLRKSQEALQAVMERYKAILQDQTEFICRFNADMEFSYVNEAYCSFFGKIRDELIGKAWMPNAHPNDLPRISEQLAKLSPQNPIVEVENRVVAADGSLRWCRFINRGFFNDSGSLVEVQSVGRDITLRHEAQEQLEISNARFNDLASRVPAGIFTIRSRAYGAISFDYISDKLLDMVGITREEALKSPEAVFGAIHPLDRASLNEANRVAVQTLKPFRWEGRSLSRGQYRWVQIESNPNLLPNGDSLWNGVITDITDRKILEDEVKHLAFHDSLTRLPNRLLLSDRMSVALIANKRNGRFGALLFIDLDNFKPLNDTHGHEAGDMLLIEVAQRLTTCVRAMDTVARIGGDEFVVMASELEGDRIQSTEQAIAIAEKVRAAVDAPYVLTLKNGDGTNSTTEHHCSASIGIVLFPEDGVSGEELLKRADMAMYKAKAEGRNRVCFYTP